MSFGKRLRTARQANEFSLAHLSRKTGIHRQNIWRWEIGINNPTAPDIAALCEVLGVSADWLLGLKEKSALNAGTFKGADEKTS